MEIIKLNLIPNGVNPTCHAKQYDEGRVIRFELFDGLTPYTLQSGDTVTLNLRKPDNTIIETSVTATQGNKYVDLVTTEQMCACVGYNLGTFKIANGSVDIGTLNFIMAVERDVLADGIPSQSVIEDLDALVEEAVGDNFYNKSETDALLDAKADKSTTYAKTDFNNSIGEILLNDSHTFTGIGNWNTDIVLSGSALFAVRFPNNSAGLAFEIAAQLSGSWTVLTTITDDKFHLVEIPSNSNYKLTVTYRGTNTITVDFVVIDVNNTNLVKQVLNNESDIAALNGDISSINAETNNINKIVGEVLFNGSYSYSGGAENWSTINLTQAQKLAVRFPNNSAGLAFEIAAQLSGSWTVLTTITDDKFHLINIPDNVSNKLVITYRGSTAVNISCLIVDINEPNLTEDTIKIASQITGEVNPYGNQGETATSFMSSFLNFTACPCKKTTKAGKVTSIYIKSYSAGTTTIYVGATDQLYLFVPRKSFDLTVAEGEQVIDVSDLDIYIAEGEQVLIKFIGRAPFAAITGTPEDDNSYYYSDVGTMQLQVYGAAKAAVFGFGYEVTSSEDYKQDAKIKINSDNIEILQDNVSVLQANTNIVSDRSGNKYRMIVQNGAIALLPLEFSHVLCVGNSYTVHPTTTDTEPDYTNNLWWGHWSMAASAKATAWTTLLENALKQKINTAKTTAVFGRRYETNPATYNLNNPNTFTYWDGSAWQSLENNLSDFSDVDAIVFFLGANYSGNDWYTLYSAMVEKFLTWFPSANLFCCSCSYFASANKDAAIQEVAREQLGTYISMVGINGASKLGSYVKGDDNNLHQVDNSAVANHFGDYGEYLILDRLCNAMGYENNATLYNITITNVSGVVLTVKSTKTIKDAVISVFAEVDSGVTLDSITVTDESNNNITVTDHGQTSYGRVFTFIMPSSNVTITATLGA